ncbi:hypothetical protein LINGRAHAP2_LOCUS28036 [Linum grandiflorum]
MDGSVVQLSGAAAAGGLIRDSQGQCIAAFGANLGRCTITRAEIRSAIFGLRGIWAFAMFSRNLIRQQHSRPILARI